LHVLKSNEFHDVGDSVAYVDEDSDNVSAANPEDLKNIIRQLNSAHWLKDNRLCVAGD
jgi:hypothetical protein